jgi:hypothetical protein
MSNSYTLIAKVKENNNIKFVKYHSPDLISFQRFLDNKFEDWYFFNVYNKEEVQIESFTKNRRATAKRITL